MMRACVLVHTCVALARTCARTHASGRRQWVYRPGSQTGRMRQSRHQGPFQGMTGLWPCMDGSPLARVDLSPCSCWLVRPCIRPVGAALHTPLAIMPFARPRSRSEARTRRCTAGARALDRRAQAVLRQGSGAARLHRRNVDQHKADQAHRLVAEGTTLLHACPVRRLEDADLHRRSALPCHGRALDHRCTDEQGALRNLGRNPARAGT